MHQPTASRRALLQGTLATILGASLGLPETRGVPRVTASSRQTSTNSPGLPVHVPDVPVPQPTLALSLTALQMEATKLQRAHQPLPETLLHLGGLNRIQGFLMEPDGEVVLLGERDEALPPAHIDDICLGLRNAYQISAVYRDAPGCTIDPWPGAKDPWSIQTVQVFGLPASAMAARYVAIDVELKRVSAGLVSLGDGVTSMYELTRPAEPPCARSPQGEQRTEVSHRFWFYPLYPTPPRFLADTRSVLVLKPVAVQLLTEQEFFNKAGRRTGTASADPQAEHFARLVTQLLTTHPPRHYAQLCNDFRVIEIGKLMHFRQVPIASLHYLLQEHSLSTVPVPAFVGGIRRQERSEVVCASQINERPGPKGKRIEAQVQTQTSHRILRGGVEVRISLDAVQFAEVHSETLDILRQQVRARRPSHGAIFWRLTA